jgi:hypothetical protein
LHGCAPIHILFKDRRGWGKGDYSVKHGYNFLLAQAGLPPQEKIWKNIWNTDNPPKINFFSWLVAHDKLLTGKIFSKEI